MGEAKGCFFFTFLGFSETACEGDAVPEGETDGSGAVRKVVGCGGI